MRLNNYVIVIGQHSVYRQADGPRKIAAYKTRDLALHLGFKSGRQ